MESGIKVVKTISVDTNMTSGSEKCVKICLKKGRVQKTAYIGNTFEKDVKELDPRKVFK